MKTLAASIFAALILFVAPAVLADGSNGQSTLTLTNPGTNVMGGVYVGPYTFTAGTGGQQSQTQLV